MPVLHLIILVAMALRLAGVEFQGVDPASRRISVQGSATVLVAPELVHIVLGIESEGDDPRQAEGRNAQIATAVTAQLAKLDPPLQLQAGMLSLGPVRDDKRNILRHVAHQVITVTARPAQVREIALAVLQAGATHILDVEYAVKDARAFRDQARRLACTAAREKAALMAGALDAKVGPVVSINEQEQWWSGRWRNPWWIWNGYWPTHMHGGYQQFTAQNVIQHLDGGEGSGGGETQSLSATIHVVFALQ